MKYSFLWCVNLEISNLEDISHYAVQSTFGGTENTNRHRLPSIGKSTIYAPIVGSLCNKADCLKFKGIKVTP